MTVDGWHQRRVGPKWWLLGLQRLDENQEPDWWFASTAIPLLAATLGPLASVFSIAALVTSWRMCLLPVASRAEAAACIYDGGMLLTQLEGQQYDDPRWCYWMNVASLVLGLVGNVFLLFNFTNRIRYIIALPVTIIMWYCATALLIGITASMQIYVPPIEPQQIYTQGYWYAVLAACLYMTCSMLLMINMMGYFLGHYPQHFNLTDSQRTLILQTMLFFVWLAGGAAVFDRVESYYGPNGAEWGFPNALYFADVTILTVGFGDIYPVTNIGRGLVLPFSVCGIIMLGLMVSSITKFAGELGSEKIIWRHVEHSRARTMDRSVRTSQEFERRRLSLLRHHRPVISSPLPVMEPPKPRDTAIEFDDKPREEPHGSSLGQSAPPSKSVLHRVKTSFMPGTALGGRFVRKPRLLLLREEKDRFNAMRRIQHNTGQWKRWYALFMSISAFGLLWCVGAVVFWRVEQDTQHMTYFQALYFCYVSLLTIGYGDLAPESNAGRPFFVFWSLIAVPTMTILVADLGDTVIASFVKTTGRLGDFTVLPQRGVWAQLFGQHSGILSWRQKRASRRRLEQGFETGPAGSNSAALFFEGQGPTLDELATDDDMTFDELARRLPNAIRQTAKDLRSDPDMKYTYERWVEITQLIRFTAPSDDEEQQAPRKGGSKYVSSSSPDACDREGSEKDLADLGGTTLGKGTDHGLIEWDWIGENSPMMAKSGEPEFVLERLLESMGRYIRKMSRINGGAGAASSVSGADADAIMATGSGGEDETENTRFGRAVDAGNEQARDSGRMRERRPLQSVQHE